MRAVLFPAKGEVRVATLPDPEPGAGEAVVAVRASGICHTDLEVLRGNYGTGAFPLVPGHEYAGEVLAVGDGVTGLRKGDRVVVDPNLECGTCPACLRGWAHLCMRLGAYGVTVHGGFAERSVVRADRLHPAGDLDFATAALAEPMGCVLNGLSPLAGREVRTALVFGAGPMGLMLGLVLRARGTAVAVVDPDRARREMAHAAGLEPLEPGSPALAARRQGCDLVVDATGVAEVAGGMIDYAANGGAVLFFGVCPQEARITVSPFEVFRRQLSLFGTHSLNHNIPAALAALAEVGSALDAVVTHRMDLDGIAAVMAGHRPHGSMKVQLAL
jgi:2-desacetyl-2-hydroxyethyl bacteriochlorophyllide A dehydrogenase